MVAGSSVARSLEVEAPQVAQAHTRNRSPTDTNGGDGSRVQGFCFCALVGVVAARCR